MPTATPPPVAARDVPAGSADVLPPPAARDVLRESLAGLAAVAAAAALALAADFALAGGPPVLNTARLGLVAVGTVVAGHALSRRPGLPAAWAAAAAAGYLGAVVAAPPAWDSLRLMLMVLAAVATAGAVFAAMPPRVRYPAVGCLAAVHFGGILCATTWPEPTPWVTSQVGTRFYMPYLQFAYLRNAYHFYSPEPGPANLLFALVTMESDAPDPDTGDRASSTWFVMPNRANHTSDPLAQSYYRRLSLTEYSARGQPDAALTTDERFRVGRDRDRVALGQMAGYKAIPYPSELYEPRGRWYQHPQPDASRYVLPSYAKHLATEYATPGRRVTNVKLYRAEHRIVSTQFFVKTKCDPYHPTLYRVHFLGDYAADGRLKDPRDPMLYWLVPVTLRKPDTPLDDYRPEQIDDYLSLHAGHVFDWRSLRP